MTEKSQEKICVVLKNVQWFANASKRCWLLSNDKWFIIKWWMGPFLERKTNRGSVWRMKWRCTKELKEHYGVCLWNWKKNKRPFTTSSVSSSWIKISQSFDGESLRCTGLHPIQIVRRRMTADHQLWSIQFLADSSNKTTTINYETYNIYEKRKR